MGAKPAEEKAFWTTRLIDSSDERFQEANKTKSLFGGSKLQILRRQYVYVSKDWLDIFVRLLHMTLRACGQPVQPVTIMSTCTQIAF